MLFLLFISIGVISASNELNNTSISSVNLNDKLNESTDLLKVDGEDIIQSSITDEIVSDVSSNSKTYIVEPDASNPNQMVKPTVQPVINNASPGDTIILKGNFAHCLFTIDKQLNIIAEAGTTISACPNYKHEGVNNHGIFYITKGGSGSVIQGFNFINTSKSPNPFLFFINGASNVLIRNCTMNYTQQDDYKFSGITIENSNNILLSHLIVEYTVNAINISDSSNITITNSIISNNLNNAITIKGSSSNIDIINNEIKNNENTGINLASANYITVVNNLIEKNGLNNHDIGSGIYVNTNITKLIVKGNIFLENGLHAIMYDYRTRNLNNEKGAENLTIVENNYFSLHSSMILHHRIYIEHSQGFIKYDAENDVYGDVGEGKFLENKYYVYMGYAFIDSDIPCGFTYYTPDIPWNLDASLNGGKYNFYLKLSDINQIDNGVYQLAIVDSEGNVAQDFNSFYMTFYVTNSTSNSQTLYKNVLIKDGIATANFTNDSLPDEYTVSVAFPSPFEILNINAEVNLSKNYSINPTNNNSPQDTNLITSKITTYPLSGVYYEVKLTDSKGIPLNGQKVIISFDGKNYCLTTDVKGIAKVKVSLTAKKTYNVNVYYLGSKNYKYCKTVDKIIVKTGSLKSIIKSSNMKVKKNKKKSFKIKLTSNKGKALKNQNILVKLNAKNYVVKTNRKGIAKLTVKLKKVKKYSISMKFLGNLNYKSCSKTNKIIVVK